MPATRIAPEHPPARPIPARAGSLFRRALLAVARRRPLRYVAITLWYVLVVTVSYVGAFLLRFDGGIPEQTFGLMLQTFPVLLVLRIAAFRYFDLYSGLIHYVSLDDVWRTIKAVVFSSGVFLLVVMLMHPGFQGYPRSVFFVEMLLALGILCSHRMALRVLRERSQRFSQKHPAHSSNGNRCRKILLVGGLNEADSLLRDVDFDGNGNGRVLGIVNENPLNVGRKLRSARILGVTSDLGRIVARARPDEVLVLPPYTTPQALRRIVDACKNGDEHPCCFKMVPSLLDLAQGNISVSMIRQVRIDDLLGRKPVRLDRTEVAAYVRGRTVMITGAGGSIGSELCRQIAHYRPSRAVLYELNEFNLYTIERVLRRAFPGLDLVPVAGDVCDERKLARTVDAHGVEIVYHAAAYKHVPLMERNVAACVRANVIGTERAARVAEAHGVKKFVLISSDKAVRPTSVMGASKRLAERVIQERSPSATKFVAVRFGNVLDSSGSVIPLFKQQIREGGPLTVTHPEITRYFMSIPEAVDLVLQASMVGKNREVMVLEMGEPIRIYDLAVRLVELSGLRAHKDIKIEFTGLRPGEKLYEELMASDDDVVRTEHDKIWVLRNGNGNPGVKHGPYEPLDMARLHEAVLEDDEALMRGLLQAWVPEGEIFGGRHEAGDCAPSLPAGSPPVAEPPVPTS